jgi:alkyl sulfatase BDS1-like metallo-beta-lactamase superfamily hydrolase
MAAWIRTGAFRNPDSAARLTLFAEIITGTIHIIYTIRGAAARNALNWSKEINEALYKLGQEAEVMFASLSWPRWGNARIQEALRAQRDTYANLNNQALHYANRGVAINEIHNVYEVPKSLREQWAARSYHGDVQNNTRGILNRFLGHYNGNPTNLIPLSPADSAPLHNKKQQRIDECVPARGRCIAFRAEIRRGD